MKELAIALRVEWRVFSALVVRELGVRHGGDATGTLWLLFEPILLVLVVYGIHQLSAFQAFNTTPFIVILLTGYLPHLAFRHAGISGLSALRANSGLLYHRQVHFIDVVYARVLVEIVTVLISFAVVFVGAYEFGRLTSPYSLAYIYLGWFYHIWFIITVCAFVTGAGLVWPLVRRMFIPWTLTMLLGYGAFFMLSWLPENFRYYLLFLPCANATEIMRYGYFGNTVPTYGNIPYTTEVCIALTFLGLLVMHWGRRHLEL
jgi:capsular polysaccharide transport system permease protein